MKIIKPSYEIMTDISPFGTLELESIERAARVCYKSEDKITDQAESAKKLIRKLIENGHEAMLEHGSLMMKFICDRGVSHELVRHRMASFAQESTRYCNYGQDKFGNEITVVEPIEFEDIPKLNKEAIQLYTVSDIIMDHILPPNEHCYWCWYDVCLNAEENYLDMLEHGATPQMARSVLPNSLKTEVVVTANYREWRHIFDLRCNRAAHPEMRRLMLPLLKDLYGRIPVIFDDIYEKYLPEMETSVR